MDYRHHHGSAYRHVSSLKDLHLEDVILSSAEILKNAWTEEERSSTLGIFVRIKNSTASRSQLAFAKEAIAVLSVSLGLESMVFS